MILQLTEDEVTRILDALDTYSCAKNLKFQDSGCHDEEAQTDRDSADWVWQKVAGQRDMQFNNSVADAVGEGQTSDKVDPFDFKGLEF
jgi:hypothetical protein